MAEDTYRWYYRRGLKVMYIVGVLLVVLVGIIFITIRYLEQEGNADATCDVVLPASVVAAVSLASWGAVVVGILVGITTYIYKKYKKKKETNV